jgi:hypothetical protein
MLRTSDLNTDGVAQHSWRGREFGRCRRRAAPPAAGAANLVHMRRWMLVALLVVGACSSPEAGPTTAAPSPSVSASPSASATAFCLDLQTFQLGVLIYRDEVAKATRGALEMDLDAQKSRAFTVARLAAEMQSTVPADLADPFRITVDAVAASAAKLVPGTPLAEVAEPLYGEQVVNAFRTVNAYRC